MFTMSLKLKLFLLADSNAIAKLIEPFEYVEGDTCAKFRPLLEGIHTVDWPFQLMDVESRCMINNKLAGLNQVSSDVYVQPLVAPNLESIMRMCVVDLDFCF